MLRKKYLLVYAWLCISILTISVYKVSADSVPAISVDPTVSTVSIGSIFAVNVNVTNVANLTAWQFVLYYLNSVVNCTGVSEGPFLSGAGGTFHIFNITNSYNATYGRILAADALEGLTSSANGNGVLATVTFQAIGGGSTALSLSNTKLLDNELPDAQNMPHQDFSGTVNVSATDDIAITNVALSKTVMGLGYSTNITVTVSNLGGYPETFNTTVYANTTIIGGPKSTTLPVGASSNLTFTWSTNRTDWLTASFAYYNITAYAGPVLNDVNVTNNTFNYGKVPVTIPGDIDGDFKVNLSDLVYLALAYGTTPANTHGTGQHQWNPNADIDSNGIVGLSDLVILATHYGKHYP